MARGLNKTVQRAGFLNWLYRFTKRQDVAGDLLRDATDLDDRPLNDVQFGDVQQAPDSRYLAVYCLVVFSGTLVSGYFANTDDVASNAIAVAALFANVFAFAWMVPKGWEGDLRGSAFLLLVVCPTAFIGALLMGMVRIGT